MPDLKSPNIDEIVENLFAAMPVIHRKLMSNLADSLGMGISHHHYDVLRMLSRQGPLPVSEIGSQLYISKPQMTAVIDKLVTQDLVTRQQDAADRRVIHVSLTAAGRSVLQKGRQALQNGITQKLAGLSEQDLNRLAAALKDINEIGGKVG